MSHWQPYLIAIVIGLLVGIEREKAHPKQKAMGVRTFLLISLLGAITGELQNLVLSALLTAFAFALIVVSYFTQNVGTANDEERGLTTEFAAGIIFTLGYLAHQSPTLSAVLGPLVAVVLFSKKPLHRFTHVLKPAEFEAALLILLSGVVVVDFLPNKVVDPWGVFNPRQFGYLVLTLAVLEFLSYVLTKIMGGKRGSIIVGFLGGFVSSTAVLLSSARNSQKSPNQWRNSICSALAAKLAALLELLIILSIVSPQLLFKIGPPIALGLIIGGTALFLTSRKVRGNESDLALRSPLEWRGVFRLAVLLAVILGAISASENWLGDQGTHVLSFFTGLVELHGVSLANATMHDHGHLSSEAATTNILLAVFASLVAKVSIAWTIDRGSFSRRLSLVFLPMALAIWITYIFSFLGPFTSR